MTVHNISNRSANDRVNSMSRRDAKAVFHPYTNAIANEFEGPLVITRGEGVYIWDENGKKYLEGMSGLWCASLRFLSLIHI